MRTALHAEWTKLRTVAGTGWLLLGLLALTVGLSVVADLTVAESAAGEALDVTKLALTGVVLGQAVVAVVAVQAVGSEYSTGLIRVTLAAVPRRTTMLAAKAATLGAVVLAVGTVAVLGCLLAGRLLLPGSGYTASNGYPPLSLTDGPTLRAAVGSVLYLALVALLSLGVATLVREPATAIGLVLGLLYLFPVLAAAVSDPTWTRHLHQIGPMSAGLAIQATKDVPSLPIGPWSGLGVLAGWAASALIAGGLLLCRCDA
jgi:ABC-2 type transport system permease protein